MNRHANAERWVSLLQPIWRHPHRPGLADAFVYSRSLQDFDAASHYLALSEPTTIAITTGFFIPRFRHWETDGPLGAVLLAACLAACGHTVVMVAEEGIATSLRLATRTFDVPVVVACLPAGRQLGVCRASNAQTEPPPSTNCWGQFEPIAHWVLTPQQPGCWIAIERPGPAYTPADLGQRWPESLPAFVESVPCHDWDRYHDMAGNDITEWHFPVHRFFEQPRCVTIGIGDGGNEIGMGKLPWSFLAERIPHGGRIACRVGTDWLIACGVSNWGAYALAAGVCQLRGLHQQFAQWAQPEFQRQLWMAVLTRVPLCDGFSGLLPSDVGELQVDGLPWPEHAAVLAELIRQVS